MTTNQWNKDNLEAIVEALSNNRKIIEELMREISDRGERVRFDESFCFRLKEMKEFFQQEKRRLEKKELSLSREVSAFYRPALRNAAVRYPKLNKSKEWSVQLYEVYSDLNHFIFGAKSLLENMGGNKEVSNA